MLPGNCLSKDVRTSVLQVLEVEWTVFEQPKTEYLKCLSAVDVSTVANLQVKENNNDSEIVVRLFIPSSAF